MRLDYLALSRPLLLLVFLIFFENVSFLKANVHADGVVTYQIEGDFAYPRFQERAEEALNLLPSINNGDFAKLIESISIQYEEAACGHIFRVQVDSSEKRKEAA